MTTPIVRAVVNAQVVPGPQGGPGAPGASGYGAWATGNIAVSFANEATATADLIFPPGRFAAAPRVVAVPRSGTGQYVVNVTAVTATGSTITVRRADGASITANISVDWIAVDSAGPPPFAFPTLATNRIAYPHPSATDGWVAGGAFTASNITYHVDPDMGDFARVAWSNATADSWFQRTVTVLAGTRFTFSIFYRNNGSTPLVVAFHQNNPPTGWGAVVPPDGQWHRYSGQLTGGASTVNGEFRVIRIVPGTVAPGTGQNYSASGTLDVAQASATDSPELLDFFSGNTPGARWVGTPGSSQSQLVVPRGSDLETWARQAMRADGWPATPAVLATNLVTRPKPTAALPWTIPVATGTSQVYDTDPGMGSYTTFAVTVPVTGNQNLTATGQLVAGIPVTASAFYRNNGPAPITVRRTFGGITSALFTVPNDGQWHRLSTTATTTSSSVFVPVQFSTAAGASLTGTLDVTGASVTPGPALFDYFDGDTPGGRWTGPAGNSVSELVGVRHGDIEGIVAARTPLELTGTGMPEGVVTAPVGSHYTDTAATNGAIRWIKHTGAGATGWRVVWGDTGDRVITSLLINGWTATTLRIRRRNDNVHLLIQAPSFATATSNVMLSDVGVGFRAVPGSGTYGAPRIPGTWGVVPISVDAPAGPTLLLSIPRDGLSGVGGTILLQWFTTDAWPTTLPGA